MATTPVTIKEVREYLGDTKFMDQDIMPVRLRESFIELYEKVQEVILYAEATVTFEEAVNKRKGGNDDRSRAVISTLTQVLDALDTDSQTG